MGGPAVGLRPGTTASGDPGVQLKLSVNEPGDKYEKEAERVADAVVRMPGPRAEVVSKATWSTAPTKFLTKKQDNHRVKLQRKDNSDTDKDGQVSDRPRFVYLASGEEVTSEGIRKLEQRVRSLFLRYRMEFRDDWLVRDTENGNQALLLRWKSSWRDPPSLWMGPDKLEKFLYSRFVEQSSEIAESPYTKSKIEKSFTDKQRQWIQEVMEMEEISLLLRAIGDLPTIVLHRVSQLGASGETWGKKIALSENLKKEIKFKGTLIHEILHFVENYTNKNVSNNIVVPKDLIMAMVHPSKKLGLEKYAFGWFIHPDKKLTLHFDNEEANTLTSDLSILGHSGLESTYYERDYEPSPMPKSGHSISPEEDLAATLSLYLKTAESRRELKNKYPLRYKLMKWYFGDYLVKLEKSRLKRDKKSK